MTAQRWAPGAAFTCKNKKASELKLAFSREISMRSALACYARRYPLVGPTTKGTMTRALRQTFVGDGFRGLEYPMEDILELPGIPISRVRVAE